MSRQFSVIRRRPQLVDIVTPFVYGTTEYRLKWASNFDGSFTQIIASKATGYIDPAVNPAVIQPIFNQGQVRIVFDPTAAGWSITNPSGAIWLKLARYDGTSETYVSPPTLLLSDDTHHGVGTVIVSGNAPSGVSISNSLQLDLPFASEDIRIVNQGAHDLYVATEAGGAETLFPARTDASPTSLTSLNFRAAQPALLVRGSGGTTSFSAAFTRSYPR